MHTQSGGLVENLANLNAGAVVAGLLAMTLVRVIAMQFKMNAAQMLADMVESVLPVAALFFLVIRPFLFQSFYIPTPSMEPTLLGHLEGSESGHGVYTDTARDRIFANRLAYRLHDPERGDIIVFRKPKWQDEPEDILIKRVVGVPGDTIEMKPDPMGKMRVWRNGKPVIEPACNPTASNEPCIREPMQDIQEARAHFGVDGPLKLGPDDYFVMGDNRNLSYDSRFWGTVKRDRIIGKAALRWWPLSRIGLIR